MTIKGDDVPPAECKVAMGEIIKGFRIKFKISFRLVYND